MRQFIERVLVMKQGGGKIQIVHRLEVLIESILAHMGMMVLPIINFSREKKKT